MHRQTRDLTEGRPLPLLVSFSLPLMVGNVFQQMYTVVDTAVVGKALGVGALAALGASDWLNWMMLGVIQGLTQGFGIMMAQDFGSRQMDRLRRTIGASAVLSAIGALVLLAVGQVAESTHPEASADAGRHSGGYCAVSPDYVWGRSRCDGL